MGMPPAVRAERIRQRLCTYSVLCTSATEDENTICPSHRHHRTQRQKFRRNLKHKEGPKFLTKRPNAAPPTSEILQLPSTSKTASVTRAPAVSWDKLMWVSFPDARPLYETATLAIQLFPEDHQSLSHDSWLAEAYSMAKLRNTVIKADNGGYYVHQGLVTLLALKSLNTISVVAHTWDWLSQQLRNNQLSSSYKDDNGQSTHGILFLHWTTNEPTTPTLDTVYNAVRLLKHTHGASFRVYPNESESWQERAKLGDIRALDDVARSAPSTFSYRPKTCFGHNTCKLQDCQKTVHKRTHSGCATHVYPSKKPTYDADSSTHWFHQEFVPALQRCEFRVFIATEPDEKGHRGRTGRVVAIAKTAFDQDTKALAAREFLPEDLGAPLTRSDLEQFALFVFESLRAQTDSMTFFESLEVGVRLDIGVGDNGTLIKSKLFVNEITRWYGGHYFSHHICAEPKTQICKAFAHAFNAYLNVG
ncbi:hypothetical protein CC86DRAFT_337369, partial [Ophiobolus disseminans]